MIFDQAWSDVAQHIFEHFPGSRSKRKCHQGVHREPPAQAWSGGLQVSQVLQHQAGPCSPLQVGYRLPEANRAVIIEIALSEGDGVARLVSLNLEQREEGQKQWREVGQSHKDKRGK